MLASELVPKSDKVMYKVSTGRKLSLAFKRDAGRRNCNPVGLEELRDCRSANFISKDLILFEIRTSTTDKSYWTFVTVDEQIKELPTDLEIELEGCEYDSELLPWSKVESRIIRGKIC